MADIAKKRQKAAQTVPPPPEPVLSSPWFYGGLALGVGLDALAFVFKRPAVALGALVPLLAPLVVVLRWIEGDEADKQAAADAQELKEREAKIEKDYEAEQAQLKAAMRVAKVDSPADPIAVFKERELVVKRRDAAAAKLAKLKTEPEVSRLAVEIPLLESEKQKLEEQVHQTGFSRHPRRDPAGPQARDGDCHQPERGDPGGGGPQTPGLPRGRAAQPRHRGALVAALAAARVGTSPP